MSTISNELNGPAPSGVPVELGGAGGNIPRRGRARAAERKRVVASSGGAPPGPRGAQTALGSADTNARLLRFLSASVEQVALIDGILEGRLAAAKPADPGGLLGEESFYLTKKQLSVRIGKKLRTIDSWMAGGLLPFSRVRHSVLFFWPAVVAELNGRFGVHSRGGKVRS
jgi:hypothetical protein